MKLAVIFLPLLVSVIYSVVGLIHLYHGRQGQRDYLDLLWVGERGAGHFNVTRGDFK